MAALSPCSPRPRHVHAAAIRPWTVYPAVFVDWQLAIQACSLWLWSMFLRWPVALSLSGVARIFRRAHIQAYKDNALPSALQQSFQVACSKQRRAEAGLELVRDGLQKVANDSLDGALFNELVSRITDS